MRGTRATSGIPAETRHGLWDPEHLRGATPRHAPRVDPQEPRRGRLPRQAERGLAPRPLPLTAPNRRRAEVRARLRRGRGPVDVYRVWLPAEGTPRRHRGYERRASRSRPGARPRRRCTRPARRSARHLLGSLVRDRREHRHARDPRPRIRPLRLRRRVPRTGVHHQAPTRSGSATVHAVAARVFDRHSELHLRLADRTQARSGGKRSSSAAATAPAIDSSSWNCLSAETDRTTSTTSR